MLKTLICDDELPALELIAGMLRDTGKIELVACCQSVVDALDIINRGGVDLAYFDIEMPQLTGVDAARSITVEPKPLIVFATAHADYAVDAFGIDAIDYILKPFDPRRVLKSVEKAVRLRQVIQAGADKLPGSQTQTGPGQSAHALRIVDAGRLYVIPFSDIVWIEAAGDYSLVHRRKSDVAIRRTISSLEAELPTSQFRRVHRSSIVSVEHISEVRRLAKGEAEICLGGNTTVRASRSYREVVSELIG